MITLASVVLVIAFVEFAVVTTLHDPSDGANIGAGLALISALSSGVALALGLISLHALRAGRVRSVVRGMAWCVVGVGLYGVTTVAGGILEEL